MAGVRHHVRHERADGMVLLPLQEVRPRTLLPHKIPAGRQHQHTRPRAALQSGGRDTQLLQRHLLHQRTAGEQPLRTRTMAKKDRPIPQTGQRDGGKPTAATTATDIPQRRGGKEGHRIRQRGAARETEESRRHQRTDREPPEHRQSIPHKRGLLHATRQYVPADGQHTRSHRDAGQRRAQHPQRTAHEETRLHPRRPRPLRRSHQLPQGVPAHIP